MNQAQRTFLIKKIEETTKSHIAALEHEKPNYPNLEKYLLNAIMSEKFELQSTEHLRQAIINKVLNMKESDKLLGDSRNMSWGENHKVITIKVEDVFVIPAAFQELKDAYKAKHSEVSEKVRQIQVQADTLITRIQLASDKTLDKMINEVDDMGDISLMDTKIKLLGNG